MTPGAQAAYELMRPPSALKDEEKAAMTPAAQAVYEELSGRKGILDGIDDQEIIDEICEATATAVLRAWGIHSTPVGYQGAAQHTYSPACDGFHEPGQCPRSEPQGLVPPGQSLNP